MTRRRSPMLAHLPRREKGSSRAGLTVKLSTTMHTRSKDPVPRPWSKLTVPADIADQLPPDCRFAVEYDGVSITYRRLDVT